MRRAHLTSSVCVVMVLLSAVILAEQQLPGTIVAPRTVSLSRQWHTNCLLLDTWPALSYTRIASG